MNLKAQVLAAATKGICSRMLEGVTTSVMQKIKKLVDGGIHARSSMSLWHTSNLGAGIRKSINLIRCNRLNTKRAQARRTQAAGGPTAGQVCPLCNASVDDAVHALVGCTFAGVRNLVAERHDAAVLDVAGAIRGGSHGACPSFADVRRRVNPNVPRVRKHAFLLPASS